MKMKGYALLLLTAILLTLLAACSISPSRLAEHQTEQVAQPTPETTTTVEELQPTPEITTTVEDLQPTPETVLPHDKTAAEETAEEPWKTALREDLFVKYGVLPEYYEDLGNGIYQVFVEVGGKIVPFVTVDSATGDYHG